MRLLLAALILVGLTGCASVTPERRTIAYSQCPALKQYTPDQMKRAASELRSLPSESQIALMITDYGKLREACRVALKTLAKQN